MSPRDLTDQEYAAQSWAGFAEATPLPTPQPLVGVHLSARLARPWALTLYAATAAGALTVPTMPVGVSSPATPIAPTMPQLGAVVHARIGPELVVFDYPTLGAVYQISPCAEVFVSVVSSWAGMAKPKDVPRYGARMHEGVSRGDSWVNQPRYTWLPGNLAPPDPAAHPIYALIPVRATAVSIIPGDVVGDTSQAMRLTFYNADGTIILGSIDVNSSPPTVAEHATQQYLGPHVIPATARMVEVVSLMGVETISPAIVWHISL